MRQILFLFAIMACIAYQSTKVSAKVNTLEQIQNLTNESIIGFWVSEIDCPQNDMTMIFELNFSDDGRCIVKCKWFYKEESKEALGKATYGLTNNKLIINFLNEKEVIRMDNIFEQRNIYNIKFKDGKLVIENSPQFRNIDINFGRGYKNRGFSKIVF